MFIKKEINKPNYILEDGTYEATILEAVETVSKSGNQMLKVKFSVGSINIFDHFVDNEVGLSRLKLLCEVVGYDVSNDIDIKPQHLINKSLQIDLYVKDENGYKSNKITFDGFRSSKNIDTELIDEDSIPF